MKLNIPITISIACQSISTAFVIITFILENWIVVKSTNVRYGMWRGCNSSQCYNWYSKGEEVLDFKLSSSYKAFQGLQSSMLGLIVITLVSLFFNLKLCPKLLPIFIIDAILIFLATCCGLVSLIVFVTDIFKSDIHNLDWCFWLSVVALVMVFFGLIFLVAFSISIE
ncbi:hypothetical protein BpHYR1_040607 [Brachionus plicatilis]|uniref:Uncharacterized protein n=1 Tax=Brachionus plicatilis TaxID=10195 RepID=A0A3M7RYZ6_BRAPC|nr:hypothetical protein BpHYR1_040607 [Brachionus plicatilis]